jgi:hypothetical protein
MARETQSVDSERHFDRGVKKRTTVMQIALSIISIFERRLKIRSINRRPFSSEVHIRYS